MKDNATDNADFGMFTFAPNAVYVEPAHLVVANDSYVWTAEDARADRGSRLYRDVFKRVLDVAFVIFTLPFSMVLIGLCALALWIEGGNPFYTQARLGKNGRRFNILKLRTMVRDADAVLEQHLANDPEMRREWNEIQKLRHDPRVTRVGHILRKTSLDELPQLWNVLTGDMSLVGPRPMMPEQLEMYGDPYHYFALKPGITGLWQVSARNSARFSYRNNVDGTYEQSLSLRLDLAILVRTIGVVLRPTGH